MIEYVVAFLALVYGFIVVRDFHKFIKRSHEAIDRDQEMLDQLEEPDFPDTEEPHGVIVVDLTMSESDAVLKFVESFRQLKDQHDRNS